MDKRGTKMTTIQESPPAERGGGRMRKALTTAALIVGLALVVLVPAASAEDVVRPGRTIEAFIGTDLVDLQSYPANRSVTIDVVRNGVVVGSVAGTTDAEGFVEFNHVGGGQFPQGDCFKPPVSPDIVAGDVVRVRTAGDPAGVFDSAVVRDLSIDFGSIATSTAANTITVSGRVVSTPSGPIVPGTDVLELRLNKATRDNTWETGPGLDQDRPGRRDLRVDIGANVQPDGTWTRVLNVSNDDAGDWQNNPGEVSLEWSVGAGGETPPAIFVADEAGGEAIAGCPPLARYAVTSSNPRVLNVANIGRGIRLAGIASGASAVSVTLDDRNAATTPVVLNATLRDAYVPGFQTWRTASMTDRQLVLLRRLQDGTLTASATYTVGGVERAGGSLRVLKDTVAPRTPTATPRPGTYPRPQLVTLSAQAGTQIYYTLDGSRPTLGSRQFVRPIRVTGTQRIKAVAFDAAGNRSPLGSFRYVIRR
jgi:hypothetical protein